MHAFKVWESRKLPAYYSPYSLTQLLLLWSLLLVDFPLTLAMAVLFLRTVFSAALGCTAIESWEQERHDSLLRRRIVTRRQVFPYDVGIWENLVVAFGYQWNAMLWLNPLARTPVVGERKVVSGGIVLQAGLEWEVNGFEDPDVAWPPVDPEKVQVQVHMDAMQRSGAFTIRNDLGDVSSFRRRQRADLMRWEKGPEVAAKVTELSREENSDSRGRQKSERELVGGIMEHEGWVNGDGERLADYGVDEELEDEDEDLPLALLMQKRREQAMSQSITGGVLKSISTNIAG